MVPRNVSSVVRSVGDSWSSGVFPIACRLSKSIWLSLSEMKMLPLNIDVFPQFSMLKFSDPRAMLAWTFPYISCQLGVSSVLDALLSDSFDSSIEEFASARM